MASVSTIAVRHHDKTRPRRAFTTWVTSSQVGDNHIGNHFIVEFVAHLSVARDRSPVFVVELEVAGLNFAKQTRLVLVVERRVTPEEDVNDDADAPHIHGLRLRRDGQHQRVTGCVMI